MPNLWPNVLGAILAIVYIGYFAYSIGTPALIVIVAICLGLMAYALYQESWNGKNGG